MKVLEAELSKEELLKELETSKRRIEELEREKASDASVQSLQILVRLATELTAEKKYDQLLQSILDGAKTISNADGGTIYIVDGDHLKFEVIINEKLGIYKGGSSGVEIPFPPIQLYDAETHEPNHHNVASHVAIDASSVNIEDAYNYKGFDFSGTRKFDEMSGYRSTSFLTIPLKNHFNHVIGVLQLINARDKSKEEVIAFSQQVQLLVESLASLAAHAVENQMLIQAQKDLFESFIKAVSDAIDEKSPYTGGHCKRVPVISDQLIRQVCATNEGPFANFTMNDDELEETRVAAWLHDIGKISTPEHIVDKATKLESIHDRIHMVKLRFELLLKDLEIDYLKNQSQEEKETYDSHRNKLIDDLNFIMTTNTGGEFMSPEDMENVHELSKRQWRNHKGEEHPLLTFDEVHNLCVSRGTLTAEQRKVINNHINVTIQILEQLPFPPHLKKVAEIAGGHHETLDGRGYPKGLTKEQLTIPARVLAIADIFEALTASDRPYKKAKKLSESIKIMNNMKKANHIDPDLFDLFLKSGIHLDYAKKYLLPEQVDEFDIQEFLS